MTDREQLIEVLEAVFQLRAMHAQFGNDRATASTLCGLCDEKLRPIYDALLAAPAK